MTAGVVDACRHALAHNLGLAPGERVVIVDDGTRPEIVSAFAAAAGEGVAIVAAPVAEINGQEPPEEVAAGMLEGDVVLLVTEKSLSWTRARKAATEQGARVASMTSITREILLRTLTVDYEPVRRRANELCDRLDRNSAVHVRTPAGTDLRMSIAGRLSHGRKGGIFREPGHWGNLPCGEAFIAPLEGTAHGIYVVDGSHAGVGKIRRPVCITVERGSAVRFEGGSQARELQALLERVEDPAAFTVAEFGIGCNHAAKVTGTILEDEKALGTCHIALGSNVHFGGTVEVPVHLDGVLLTPDIIIN